MCFPIPLDNHDDLSSLVISHKCTNCTKTFDTAPRTPMETLFHDKDEEWDSIIAVINELFSYCFRSLKTGAVRHGPCPLDVYHFSDGRVSTKAFCHLEVEQW